METRWSSGTAGGGGAPVAIVGAGPVGLALALALARQGVRSVLLERKSGTSGTSKAPGVHVRTREALRQWEVEDRFLAAGRLAQPLTVHAVAEDEGPLLTLDFSELSAESDRPGLLILEQSETERLLLEAVRETGLCDVRFDHEVVTLRREAEGVRLTARSGSGEREVEARYAVGCDGAGSFVRKALDLPFPGSTYRLRPVLADVAIAGAADSLPEPRAWTGGGPFAFAVRLRPGLWRLVQLAEEAPDGDEVPPDEVAELTRLLLGVEPEEVVWASRFRIHIRASPRFRVGRVLLAGDAAHVHSPAGGFGMNGGIQDAHDLAWKLAACLDGGDEERLLESYEVERRAVVVETLSPLTDRLTRLFIQTPPAVRRGAWAAWRLMMRVAPLRRRALRRMTMLDLRYPPSPLLRDGDRAAGVRLPNPELVAPGGARVRLYELLGYRPLLLEVGNVRPAPALAGVQRMRVGPDGYADPGGLLRDLLDGEAGYLLARPDGYLAWARATADGLADAARHALGR